MKLYQVRNVGECCSHVLPAQDLSTPSDLWTESFIRSINHIRMYFIRSVNPMRIYVRRFLNSFDPTSIYHWEKFRKCSLSFFIINYCNASFFFNQVNFNSTLYMNIHILFLFFTYNLLMLVPVRF
jgi:hypothetical protein